jgi:hypothetical protein
MPKYWVAIDFAGQEIFADEVESEKTTCEEVKDELMAEIRLNTSVIESEE